MQSDDEWSDILGRADERAGAGCLVSGHFAAPALTARCRLPPNNDAEDFSGGGTGWSSDGPASVSISVT